MHAPQHNFRISANELSTGEIKRAINQLKSRKAAGLDNVPPELFKTCHTAIAKLLHPLLKTCWDNEQVPEEWKDGLIIKLPKKDDLSECHNW
jgi:hypothetical protein